MKLRKTWNAKQYFNHYEKQITEDPAAAEDDIVGSLLLALQNAYVGKLDSERMDIFTKHEDMWFEIIRLYEEKHGFMSSELYHMAFRNQADKKRLLPTGGGIKHEDKP